MKKKLFFSFLPLFLLSQQGITQNTDIDPRERLTFGVKAGINYSNVWDKQGQEFQADPIVGFAGGVFVLIPVGMFAGIQPEFLISQKGFQGSGTLLGSQYSFSRVTTFIDIPVLFEIKPAPFLFIVLGPQYSFLLTEKNEYTFGANSTVQQQEFDNDNVRNGIFGFTAGIDINIQHIVISGRACWDLQKNNSNGSNYTPRYNNQWLQFTLGYKL